MRSSVQAKPPDRGAQKEPDGKAFRKGVTQGGNGGQQRGEQNAAAYADHAVQAAHKRIERKADQPVHGQDDPHFPQRGQPGVLIVHGQHDIQHGITEQTGRRDQRDDNDICLSGKLGQMGM